MTAKPVPLQARSPPQQTGQPEKVQIQIESVKILKTHNSVGVGSSDSFVSAIMDGYVDMYRTQMEALYNYEIPVIRQLQMG